MFVISGAPTIELKEAVEGAEGFDVNIVAKIQGCPFPSLVWQKAPLDKPEEKAIVQYGQHVNKIVGNEKCTLLIQQSKRDDSAVYTLTATNSIGKASKDLKLTVLGNVLFEYFKLYKHIIIQPLYTKAEYVFCMCNNTVP